MAAMIAMLLGLGALAFGGMLDTATDDSDESDPETPELDPEADPISDPEADPVVGPDPEPEPDPIVSPDPEPEPEPEPAEHLVTRTTVFDDTSGGRSLGTTEANSWMIFDVDQSGDDHFSVSAEPGLIGRAYTVSGWTGDDIFDVQSGVRVENPGPANDGTSFADSDHTTAHITAEAVAALSQPGYANGLFDENLSLQATQTQPAAPEDAAVFVNLRDPEDSFELDIAPDVDGFVHEIRMNVDIDTSSHRGGSYVFNAYVLTDSAEAPDPEEVLGQATVDPDTGDVTTTDGNGSVLAIVQLSERFGDENTDPDITLNREVSSTQEVDLSFTASSGGSGDIAEQTTRAGDVVAMATDSYVVGGTSLDDVFTMAEIDGSGESHMVLMGGKGDDVFNVGGGAVVYGGQGADLINASLNEADLQDLPPAMTATLNYVTWDGIELFGDANEYEPLSAALNVDLLDEEDAVVINLDDDITGYVHQVQFSLAQPVTITLASQGPDEVTTTDVINDFTAFVRTDSADMPELSASEIVELGSDLLAVVRIGSELQVPSGADEGMFVVGGETMFGVNSDPQITINREISTVQTIP